MRHLGRAFGCVAPARLDAMGQLRIVAASLVLLVACQSHVELTRPATPTRAERIAAFDALRPVGMTRSIKVMSGEEVGRTLVLANGEEVAHADDLLAVVPPDSTTARAARSYRRANRRGRLSFLGFVVTAAAGIYFVGAGTDAAGEAEQPERTIGLVLLAGAVVAIVSGGVHHLRARDAQKAAFATYEQTLLDSLGMCVDALRVVPCEDLDGAPTTPASPP